MVNSSSPASPSPNMSIITFLIFTIIYFIAKFFAPVPTAKTFLPANFVIFIIYILAIIFSSYLMNLGLTTTLCGTPQVKTTIIVTFLPWLIIFGLLHLALLNFPGWLIPFSNTFGYGIAKLAGLSTKFRAVVKDPSDTQNKKLSHALQSIYNDQSLLINEIPNAGEGFDVWWKESSELIKSGADTSSKEALRSLIKLKNLVAEFMWFSLTGLLTVSASYNYIIKSSCEHSVAEMEAQHKDYEADVETTNAKNNIPDRVYTSYE